MSGSSKLREKIVKLKTEVKALNTRVQYLEDIEKFYRIQQAQNNEIIRTLQGVGK